MVAVGPEQNRTAPQHRVRFLGFCGRAFLTLSITGHDPERSLKAKARAGLPRRPEGKDRTPGPCYSTLIGFTSHGRGQMSIRPRRREFIAALGGAAVLPLSACAQQPGDRVRRIGVLMGFDENDPEGKRRYSAFTQA